MKYRPSKRVIWLIIPLMPVLIMCAGVWLLEGSEDEDISTRGSKPPAPRSFSRMDWYDDGVFALMDSRLNPWQNQMGHQFGYHLMTLKRSDVPKDQEEYRRLMELGKEWYERILVRYPDLAVTYKNLPAEQNGLLQWNLFEKRLWDAKQTIGPYVLIDLPDDLTEHFGDLKNRHPWNAEAVKGWLDNNRTVLEEARAIALMPDRSSKDYPNDGLGTGQSTTSDFSKAFLMEARLFAEEGDINRSLESIRAAKGIADHLQNGEAPTMMQGLQGANIQRTVDRYVLTRILPDLPAGQTDVGAWENAVNPTLREPEDFVRMVRGEWNTFLPVSLLPALADSKDPHTPNDAEAMAEAYTRSSSSLVTRNESLTLADLPSNPFIRASYTDLSRRSQQIAKDNGMSADSFDLRSLWERAQAQTGMTKAAFAILKGQPVPNDPIHGQPYQWDPATRKLSLPDIPEYKKSGIKPIVLPKL